MRESPSDSDASPPSRSDITSHLPLQLIKSQIIPPAPSRSQTGFEPIADFLLEFSGYSWIAYGASSLVVISHFPNALLEAEKKLGPVFQQVMELSREADAQVSSLSWSPVTPSFGELAVAIGDRIVLLNCFEDETSSSSFCWAQTAILVQPMKIETIKWTGSGDGMISGGTEVVLWKKEESWEKTWSFKPEVPQSLVSTCWSVNGLFATAPLSKLKIESSFSPLSEAGKCVLVFKGTGHSKYPLAELHHPMPVTMIQWRPANGKPSSRYARHALRAVLLTSCLDGTARLWGEVDDGRILKTGKDNDHKAVKLSFYVVAVIEVNQALNGFLGSNVFISWAIEVEGVIFNAEEACYSSFLDTSQHETTGRCEWLIGLGPRRVTILWAIHCLDDFAPLRLPRVTLWKKLSLVSFETEASQLLVSKVIMMRNSISGPPLVCSFLQLLPCNSFAWTQLHSQASSNLGKSAHDHLGESMLVGCSAGVLEVEGHYGRIFHVAVHPFPSEVELAASLDGNGSLLFWYFSSFFNSCLGLPASTPFWKVCGKTSVPDDSPKYKCLCWAPAVLGDDQVLLMGHKTGVDCFVVKILKNGKGNIALGNLCSIPFSIEGHEQGLSRIFSTPLSSNCEGNFTSSRFLVVGMDDFLAVSWEITIHVYNTEGNCCNSHLKTFESNFSGNTYSVSVHPCSSIFPVAQNDGKITSCAVVCPSDLVSTQQKLGYPDEMGSSFYAYHMITGYINGSIKLWRSVRSQSESATTNWALVGVLPSEHGPILAVSPSPCYQKIATARVTSDHSYSTTVCIWECMHVQGVGSYIQEDKLFFDGKVVSLKWLRLGNGQLLLGVCLQNELRIYVCRRSGGLGTLKREKCLEVNAWICVAASSALLAISDFFWGPKGSVVVLHDEHFSLFSHFLQPAAGAHSNRDLLAPNLVKAVEPSELNIEGQSQLQLYTKIYNKDNIRSVLKVESSGSTRSPIARIYFWSMSEVAENIAGRLPLYHPTALLINLYSGNWRRALVVLRHLVKNMSYGNMNKRGHVSNAMLSPVPLLNYLEGNLSSGSSDKLSSSQLQNGLSFFPAMVDYEEPSASLASASLQSEIDDFDVAFDQLWDCSHVDTVEKMEALAIIDILREIRNPHSSSVYESLDESGRRFWVAVRFQQLYFSQKFKRLPQADELDVSSALISWAFHSDCHDSLFNSLLSKEPSWEEMRSMGVGFWYTNVAALRAKIELLARQRYMKTKDPKACALLYIALNRVQVLVALFKISKDDKDKVLAGFLCRNFQEDKNKSAALKNAYVLMGKHQLELAIAFFLLGGDASSAITICAKNLGDEQLALVICRLVEGVGGPLERNIISKFLLPFALSKGDLWMTSFLEWVLGEYHQSFLRILGVEMASEVYTSTHSSSHASFLDPSIGRYCQMLAMNPCMKNAIGEFNANVLSQFSTLMSAAAFTKCGLSLEALECLSSSDSPFDSPSHGKQMHRPTSALVEVINPFETKSLPNWISLEVSSHIILYKKLSLAVQYIVQLLRIHPSYADTNGLSFREFVNLEVDRCKFEKLLEEFEYSLTTTIAYFHQKFGLVPGDVISMVVLHTQQIGLEFIGRYISEEFIPKFLGGETRTRSSHLSAYPFDILLKAAQEFSCLDASFIFASCKISSNSAYLTGNSSAEQKSFCLAGWAHNNQGIAWTIWYLRSMIQLFLRSYPSNFCNLFNILGLLQYHMLFVSAWLVKSSRAVLLTVRPVFDALIKGSVYYEIQMNDLIKLLAQVAEVIIQDSDCAGLGMQVEFNEQKEEQIRALPGGMIWHITHSSLWVYMSAFLEDLLGRLDASCVSPSLPVPEQDNNDKQLLVGLIVSTLSEFHKFNLASISFYCSKLFAIYLLQTANVLSRADLERLEGFLSQPEASQNFKMAEDIRWLENGDTLLGFEQLSYIFTDPQIINGVLLKEYHNWLPLFKQKSYSRWFDASLSITKEFDSEENWDKGYRLGSPSSAAGSPLACLSPDDHPFKGSSDQDLFDLKKVLPFRNPIEIYKRNGELLEALCINSTDQCQAAIASNRKGIVFFQWDDGVLHRGESEYIWGEAEWPHNGWAGSESVPVPTCVSPGVGLGSKMGSQLGLGGATIGTGALAGPSKDLNGSRVFGIPGYTGVGASDLGWGVQEGFEEFLDPPATVDNVRTRAFASHPSRPFFLVGSSNTHIYLWEFGKEKGTATYGVLPAANVPPPYALASVSAVRFDHCGHRFVTAALDGTVSTWQLEVGGRSNVRPTESSACFSNHTSDVTYVTASGSIVAAAGHSSNGVNVVVWDTLAPPATSQASIMCHEGGARSLAVFDNDIGSGSISPLILTGGKGGDVGLHDFRYIATGKTKKQKHLDTGEHNTNLSSSVDMRSKTGDQNRNGMLWYIPKAHSASVTKITTIPDTSFFLTGSKDGDVKLWDAKRATLVYHWPKLHERHTFLQPNSRGFGGVVRAAVTDIQVVSHGFLTCGGDGVVKFVRFQEFPIRRTL